MKFQAKLLGVVSGLLFDGFKATVAVAAFGRLFLSGGDRISDEVFILAIITSVLMFGFGVWFYYLNWKGDENGS